MAAPFHGQNQVGEMNCFLVKCYKLTEHLGIRDDLLHITRKATTSFESMFENGQRRLDEVIPAGLHPTLNVADLTTEFYG
jgi:hypothetical protein